MGVGPQRVHGAVRRVDGVSGAGDGPDDGQSCAGDFVAGRWAASSSGWCLGSWTRVGSTTCAGSGSMSFSYRKRHHYLTLVVDHDRQRVVWAGKGRSAKTLEAFFDRLGPAGCERLELVTADLAASWQKALQARVPHARVVFDRFHVERLASDAVDEVRRAQQRGTDAKTAKTLKGSRYCLLKHPTRLKPGEKRRLATVAPGESGAEPRLRAEGVPGDDSGAGHARRRTRVARPVARLGVAVASGAVREAGRTIRKHAVGILAYLDTKMTNGPGRGHQQQAAGHRAPRLRFPLARGAHLDAVPLLRRHRTGAASTHNVFKETQTITPDQNISGLCSAA